MDVDIVSCFKFGLSFFLSFFALGGVFFSFFLFFFLPRYRIEVLLINLYIRRQGWNLVRLGVYLGLNCIYYMVH